MKRKILDFLIVVAALILMRADLHAQQFIWVPINPSFGGNPYNSSWLLSKAQAQNDKKDPSLSTGSYSKSDPLADFKSNLNRSVLSQLSKSLMAKAFGESSLKDGTYDLGDYSIDITTTADGIKIHIIDTSSGGETNVIVPYY